jgi:putative ABC transport system ATP-binding protein
MKRALDEGDRLVMMHDGRIIVDIDGPQKADMDVPKLVALFGAARGAAFVQDDALLR